MNSLEMIFRAVLEISWRTTCLILVFLMLRPLLRKHLSARVMFWVWIALAIRLLLPCSIPVKWSPFGLVHLAQRNAPVRLSFDRSIQTPVQSGEIKPGGETSPSSSKKIPTAVSISFSALQWGAILWIIGAGALVYRRIRAHRDFARQLQRRSFAIDGRAEAIVVRGQAHIPILITDLVGTPALHGIFRPQLLFPPGLLAQLSAEEIQLIIAHELGHYRRRDLLAHGLLHAASVLHWFNPLVWISARVARHDCELACDEHVVRGLGPMEPQTYGATLLKLLGLARNSHPTPLGLGIVESKQQITRRIKMIITNQPSTLFRHVLGGLLLTLIAGTSLTREGRAEETAASSDQSITTTAPNGWWKNGDSTAAYSVGIDHTQMREGQPSAYVKSIQAVTPGFGGMMQMCSAENFTGKRLRFSAWMKTDKANEGGAHLWFRVDGKERDEMLQFDNMDNRPVKGTTEWQHYSLVLDVPANATALAYGFFVGGTGQAWVSGTKIEEVGTDVPSTNLPAGKRSLPKAPVNLGFN